MDLPVKFPTDTEVILEDVARFRALSPEDRMRSIRGLLADGEFLMRRSPKAAWLKQYSEEQELLAQRNIREFIARHEADLVPRPGGSVRAVEILSEAFAARSVRYALVGGLASAMRGQPRFTQDVAFLLDVPQAATPGLLNDLIGRGFTLDAAVVAKEYVQHHITTFTFGTVRIDWLKPVHPFYARVLSDAEPLEWSEGHTVRVATAEGLILTKMVAFRPQDQHDIDVLLTANRDDIDVDLIREEWSPFAATEPDRTAWLDAAVARRVVRRE